MTTEWLGGGFMIALAAVLWLVYLVPSWFRSRQYLATERNAVRLQQTLRILAETSEMPDEVRVEASARRIAEQERILKHRVAEQQAEAIPAAVRTADRLRRSRAVTAGVLALSIAVAVLGGMQAVYTGAWIILVGGVISSVVAIAVLVKLSTAGRRLKLPRPALQAAPAFVDHAETGDEYDERDEFDEFDGADVDAEGDELEEGSPVSSWIPVAVPRPLYLAGGAAAPLGLESTSFSAEQTPDAAAHATSAGSLARAAADGFAETDSAADAQADPDAEATAAAARTHQESLLRAAAEAEEALRARLAAEHETVAELPAPKPVAEPAPAAPSRFARMGIVDDDTTSHLDLDAVLAARRAG
ncbi:hypothetical protein [Herbiconiux daphne]|uniref:Large exoprotein n=1 Tax=Herbiconiux daphne TaxID=2970914 RepID=A0ABT2GXX5_9MICO|nr:hypothetical protein [Herbiconiux daphne]MCS5732763.1 hypothetical protein [Herbiconiux daphne]